MRNRCGWHFSDRRRSRSCGAFWCRFYCGFLASQGASGGGRLRLFHFNSSHFVAGLRCLQVRAVVGAHGGAPLDADTRMALGREAYRCAEAFIAAKDLYIRELPVAATEQGY